MAEGEQRPDAPNTWRRTNPLVVVLILLLILGAYFVLIGIRGVFLLEQSRPLLKVLGAAVLVLPVVGGWVVVAELRFGVASQRLAERLRDEGFDTSRPHLGQTLTGRPERAAADAFFETQRAVVEADPTDWRGWFVLAQAYDLAGDRKRARMALRTAIDRSS